jgi:hypothetical protein
MNGFASLSAPGIINCIAVGASDQNCTVGFQIPEGHLGGGHVLEEGAAQSLEVVRLDDLLGADFRCDLVKIDVEGHELAALRGMGRIIANSPMIKILFEKLGTNVGTEKDLEAFFVAHGMTLWAVEPNATLRRLTPGGFAYFDGYVLAARPDDPELGELFRGRFCIYPSQLHPGPDVKISGKRLEGTARQGQILFYGPYWFLGRGQYRLRLHGTITGAISITIASRFGYLVTRFEMRDGGTECRFTIERDAVLFECVARAIESMASISLERIEIIRGWA